MTDPDEIRAWTLRNQQTRSAYRLNPTATCAGMRPRVDGSEEPCPNPHSPNNPLCRACQKRARHRKDQP